jgi:hypothetical protein
MTTDSLRQDTPAQPSFHFEQDPALGELATLLWGAHQHIRAGVRQALMQSTTADLAAVAAETQMDTLFRIDEIAEKSLFEYFDAHQSQTPPFLLVGEFETGEAITFGKGEPRYRVLFDPIDGTRWLMYAKNSGWILSGILPEKGEETRLAEVLFALQTEIPLLKHLYAETYWASPGRGAFHFHENLLTGEHTSAQVHARASKELLHGFVSFVNFFPYGKTVMAALEEDFLQIALAQKAFAAAPVFEDQHLSTAGQLHALWQGQLKLVVDVRPQLNRMWRAQNQPTFLCAHPYDLSTWLIAHEAGVVLLSPEGEAFDGPADAVSEIGWIGFTHAALAQRHLGQLLETLQRHGLR